METNRRTNGFTRRRTFTVEPRHQKPALPTANRQHQQQMPFSPRSLQEDGHGLHFHRTTSAPVFHHRPVESINSDRACRPPITPSATQQLHDGHQSKAPALSMAVPSISSAASARQPVDSRRGNSRPTVNHPLRRRAVSAGVSPRDLSNTQVHTAHSRSPEPRNPQGVHSESSLPTGSPARSLFDNGSVGHTAPGAFAVDGGGAMESRRSSGELRMPSIASSISCGALGAVADLSHLSPHWGSTLASPRPPEKKREQREKTAVAEQSSAAPPAPPDAAEDAAARAGQRSVAEGSSLYPDALAHTLPPNPRSQLRKTAMQPSGVEPVVRITVRSCTGLPSAPFGVDSEGANGLAAASTHGVSGPKSMLSSPSSAAATNPSAANEVYVYMRSSHGATRYKSPCVPYAVNAPFPESSHCFEVPQNPPGVAAGVGDQVLTFTAAVRLASTGKQVKLGVCQMALCNLRRPLPQLIWMPIVAKAGTSRARQRGVLTVSVAAAEACPAVPLGLPTEAAEAALRHRICSVVRRACLERLDQVEVLVRRHCCDSPQQVKALLATLEGREVLTPSVDTAPAGSERRSSGKWSSAMGEKGQQECSVSDAIKVEPFTASPRSFSAERERSENSVSSPFTSLVLEERHALHRSLSCTTPPAHLRRSRLEAAAPAAESGDRRPTAPVPLLRMDLLEKKRHTAASTSEGQPVERVAGAGLRRSLSASTAPQMSLRRQADLAASPAAFKATRTANEPICVHVRAVQDLCTEEGLPLTGCRDCFVQLGTVGGQLELTTKSAAYDGREAVFNAERLQLDSSLLSDRVVLRCRVLQGSARLRHEVGSCEVTLRSLFFAAASVGDDGGELAGSRHVLVKDAGTPRASIAGRLVLSLSGPPSIGRPERKERSPRVASSEEAAREGRDVAVLQRRVLSHVWHHCRAELHRVDSIAVEARRVGFSGAVRACVPQRLRSGEPYHVSAAVRNTVGLTVHSLALSGYRDGAVTSQAAATCLPASVKSVFVSWTCGCYRGTSKCVALDGNKEVAMDASWPPLEDLDPMEDELCVVVYGDARRSATCNERDDESGCVQELCRVHVSVRSFCGTHSKARDAVRLPLVWRAGERGAYEGGYVDVSLLIVEPRTLGRTTPQFRTSPWKGFHSDWPARADVARYLRCYASDQLHRLLPLLAEVEGSEDGLLRRLRATYGPVEEPVVLRVCLVALRAVQPVHGKVYLKLYHGDTTVLRTPPIECSPSADGVRAARAALLLPSPHEGRTRGPAVPLLDEDKYLFYFSTHAPHQETLLIKMGVEHLLRRNDVVAYAELSMAAFVSLESRLDDSSSAGKPFTSAKATPPRAPLWVLLRSDANETVAEVAVRVEWVKAAALAPVRRVRTHTKSPVAAAAAVLLPSTTSSNSTSSSAGGRLCSPIPQLDRPTLRDLFSLLQSYRPDELYRWSWYLSRFPEAATAHRLLRRELLVSLSPPAVNAVCTVYVDVAGLSPRSAMSLSHSWGRDVQERLVVSGFFLSARTPTAAQCRVLPGDAARATIAAAAILGAVDGDGDAAGSRCTLRLDVAAPTARDESDELCLVFSVSEAALMAGASGDGRASSVPRRSHSAEHFRQLRSRSSSGVSPPQRGGRGAQRQRGLSACPAATRSDLPRLEEVGRVYLSLRALLTCPEVYRPEEVVSVPLAASAPQRRGSTAPAAGTVLGDVYLRVRTPAHESVPPWLRLSEEELSRLYQRGGAVSRKDVRVQLQQHQLHMERARAASAAEVAHVHASFFASHTAPVQRADGTDERVDAMRSASNAQPKPPVPVAAFPATRKATSPSHRVDEAEGHFTLHNVYSRVTDAEAYPSQLDDFTTPHQSKGERSINEWTSEQGGMTVNLSSERESADGAKTGGAAKVQNQTARRALAF